MNTFSTNEMFSPEMELDKIFTLPGKCADALTTLLPNGQLEERLKVDRKKFEQMLNGENIETGLPDDFFQRVMKKTNATISWPPKLKPGTKSKKDPHIRITGTSEEIAAAKEIIMSYLDSRRNRVTLKMDVAFTDHSHIIGKGGRSIQKVMDDTGCHIHFPDSNRTSTLEKSNQVSIAGTALGAEQARCRIRELLPITFVMDIPMTVVTTNSLDMNAPAIQSIQQTYGVAISMRFSARHVYSDFALPVSAPNFITVSVRGTRGHVVSLRQAVLVLIEYLVGSNMQSIPLTVSIEIAAQHHPFVIGRGESNLKTIMQQTGVVISFPENCAIDSKLPIAANNRKTTVTIKGNTFDSVFVAWQELLGCLPLVLIFDLREGQELDSVQVTKLMEQMKVSILIKPKQKQNLKSIMVRGQERDSRLLFEVRRQILDLDESEVPVCCDQHAWALASKLISMFLPYCGFPGMQPVKPFSQTTVPPGIGTINNNVFQPSNPLYLKAFNQLMPVQNTVQSHQMNDSIKLDKPVQNLFASTSTPINSSFSSNSTPESNTPTQACNSLEKRTPFNPLWTDLNSHGYNERKVHSLRAIRSQASATEVRTPTSVWSGMGFSKTTPSHVFKDQLASDWKSAADVPATQLTDSLDLPMHSNFWESEKFNAKTNTDFGRKNNFSQTQYLDVASNIRHLPEGHLLNSPFSVESSRTEQLAQLHLSTVLAELGASKYVDVFEHQHIDFKTFLTLNDADLQELGIAYFGRQKLLSIIIDLKRSLGMESISMTRFDAAPGAERRRNTKKFY